MVDIVKVGTEINRGISTLIYSDPGVGKTTCLAKLPAEETLIINVEAGLGPLLGTNISVFYLKRDLKDLATIFKYLLVEKHPYKYIAVDNISELQEWMLMSLTEMRKKDFSEIREHGDASSKMREYLYNFRNLVERGINVIFTAWEMPLEIEKTQDGIKTKLYPKLYRGLSPEVCGIVDLVGHLECHEKSGDRYFRFEGNERCVAKSQYRGIDKFEPADLMYVYQKIHKFNYSKAKPIKTASKDEVDIIKNQPTKETEDEN